MNLTPAQEMQLENADKANQEYRRVRDTEEALALRIAEANVSRFSRERDHAIRQAADAGVPKDRIRRALRIGHSTLLQSLERTAR